MRLDQYLVERGLYPSREKAKLAVLAGEVEVLRKGRPLKPGEQVGNCEVEINQRRRPPFVSRGGEKLQGALDAWNMDVQGRQALDIGSSTGGFTDCLLASGAKRVIALDVGEGLLHWKLRNDPRVHVMEGVNARFLYADMLPFLPDLVCIDVSFISLRLIFRQLNGLMAGNGEVIALVKPQFEAGRQHVGKGGVVKDPGIHLKVLVELDRDIEGMGFFLHEAVEAFPRGKQGNREFMTLWKKEKRPQGELDLEGLCKG